MVKVFIVHPKSYFGRRNNLRANSRASKEGKKKKKKTTPFSMSLHIHWGNCKLNLGLGSWGVCNWGLQLRTSCELRVSLDWFSKRRPGNVKVSGEILGKIKEQKQHETFYIVPRIRIWGFWRPCAMFGIIHWKWVKNHEYN